MILIMQEENDDVDFDFIETDSETEDSPKAVRFARYMREKRNGCPYCAQIQAHLEKSGDLMVEEWIYIAHLSSAHGIMP